MNTASPSVLQKQAFVRHQLSDKSDAGFFKRVEKFLNTTGLKYRPLNFYRPHHYIKNCRTYLASPLQFDA